MSRRLVGGAAAACTAGILVVAAPTAAIGHAIGGTYQLPIPLGLYLIGAGVAVGASFVVTSIRSGSAVSGPRYPTARIAPAVAVAARAALRILGLVWWYGAIAAGIVIGDISPLPYVLFWIGVWVALPIVAVVLGNPWPAMSPFRSTFAALDAVARRLLRRPIDAGLPYPAALATWPAVVLLGAGIWAELVLPGSDAAATVARVMIGYTVLTLVGMAVFGQIAWLRHAELFEVELGWFGRVGPLARRSTTGRLCDGCGEGCDPRRCIDCPECSVAADDDERRPELRPWIAGLADVRRVGWSDAGFIVLALAGVTFDGLSETAAGAALLGVVQPAVIGLLGPTGGAFLIADTLGLAVVGAAFAVAFLTVALATHLLSDPGRRESLATTAGLHAATLLPIAAGYLIAHYLTLVVQGAIWLPSLVVDPLLGLAPQLDWVPTSLVWYVSVAAIVGGHIAGIVLAHRLARAAAPRRSTVTGLPVVALMIGYTVLSLWIIAQPLVVEPGVTPTAVVTAVHRPV